MTLKTLMIAAGVAGALMGMPDPLQADIVQPSERELTRAVTDYLSDHGDLCVGKFIWPRVVTQQDQLTHTNDAVQLPVLERLGLVESTEISAPAAVDATTTAKRYSLTAKGRRFYLQKKRTTLGVHDQPVEHDQDLCVARLKLDKVVKWSPPEQVHGHLETVVRYTYHIKSADWMADPEARKVFPVVDRIIRGAGNMMMTATLQAKNDTWVPAMLGH